MKTLRSEEEAMLILMNRLLARCARLLLPLCLTTAFAATSAAQAADRVSGTAASASWRISDPVAQGVDAQGLASLRRHLEQDTHVRSLLMLRRDHLVFEYTRKDVAPDELHGVASVTKSIVSALTGIALAQGHLSSLDQKIVDFFPELADAGLPAGARNISLRHLLTMTSGFSWNERASFTPATWSRMDDHARLALSREPILPPGKVFNYDTASAHLLGIALSRAVGMSLESYAQQHLFGPLGIVRFEWPKDRQGHNAGGHGLRLTTRDMAAFGQLYLRRGKHADKPLIPADFVDASVQAHVAAGSGGSLDYGYFWWISTTPANQRAYSALGYGGQAIYVVPELDLVVVIASNQDKPTNANRTIIREMILPAISP